MLLGSTMDERGQPDVRDRPRIPALDGIRGLAILLVMFLHFADRSPPIGLANRLYTQVTGIGWIGVDLFFVLSGFLITGVLIDSRKSARYFRDFYARRTLRIFPLYYACLVAWIVVAPLLHPSSAVRQRAIASMQQDQLWYWTYLSNWKMGLDGQMARHGDKRLLVPRSRGAVLPGVAGGGPAVQSPCSAQCVPVADRPGVPRSSDTGRGGCVAHPRLREHPEQDGCSGSRCPGGDGPPGPETAGMGAANGSMVADTGRRLLWRPCGSGSGRFPSTTR